MNRHVHVEQFFFSFHKAYLILYFLGEKVNYLAERLSDLINWLKFQKLRKLAIAKNFPRKMKKIYLRTQPLKNLIKLLSQKYYYTVWKSTRVSLKSTTFN